MTVRREPNGEPTPTIEPFPAHGTMPTESEPSFARFAPLPTPDTIKQDYLFGLPLKSALTGQTLADETIERFIVQSISEIEHSLNLYISPITIEREAHSYQWVDFFYAYGWLQLNHRPILEVHSLEVCIPGQASETFAAWPTNWLKVDNAHGVLQIVPLTGAGSIMTSMASSGASYPLRLFSAQHYPQFWRVGYRVGFEVDRTPALLVDLISTCVAIRCLNMIGPILFPYSSYGISLDGLSQSVGTPGPQFLAARIQSLQQQRQELLEAAKTQYEMRLNMSVLG